MPVLAQLFAPTTIAGTAERGSPRSSTTAA
jgi:hypothetical protein